MATLTHDYELRRRRNGSQADEVTLVPLTLNDDGTVTEGEQLEGAISPTTGAMSVSAPDGYFRVSHNQCVQAVVPAPWNADVYVIVSGSADLLELTAYRTVEALRLAVERASADARYAPIGASAGIPRSQVSAFQPTPFRGINRPSFNALGLRGVSGLAIDSGTIVADVVGVLGTGHIDLPGTLDRTGPFRFSAVVEVGATDDGGYLDVQLGNGTNNNRGVLFTFKGTATTGYNLISVASGSGVNNSLFSGQMLTAGTYEVYVVSDGTRVQAGVKPTTTSDITTHVRTGSSSYVSGKENHRGATASDFNYTGTEYTWDAITAVRVRSSTKTIKLQSVFVNMDGLAAPTNDSAGFSLFPIVDGPGGSPADAAVVVRTRGYDGRTPLPLVIVGHPNDSNKMANAATEAHRALLDAGYVLLYVQGDAEPTLTGANSSDWGNTVGAEIRKAALDYVLALMPQIGSVQWLGESMGLLTGLAFHQRYPGTLSSIAGFSGVTNLSYAYSSEGFKSVIDTAHGSSAVADVYDSDPNLTPSTYADVPIHLWHGTNDTLIHKTNHADLFKTNVEAVGGDVGVTAVTGGGHVETTFWAGVTGAEVLAFFEATRADA